MHKLLRGAGMLIVIGGMAVLPLVASADDGSADTPPPTDDLPPVMTAQQLIPNLDQVLAIANSETEPALDYIASTLPVPPPADNDIQP